MNKHVAGAGLGALVGVALAALGTRVGLHLDDTTAASLGVAVAGVGVAFGHAFGSAWSGPGVFPAVRRGLFGAKKEKPQAAAPPVA